MSHDTICVDFDGVLHSYTSGWQGITKIPDPPVNGSMPWLARMSANFTVAIYSSRSRSWFGRRAMRLWVGRSLRAYYSYNARAHTASYDYADGVLSELRFPAKKPAALIYLDDRGWRFDGVFPTPEDIDTFRPWNRR